MGELLLKFIVHYLYPKVKPFRQASKKSPQGAATRGVRENNYLSLVVITVLTKYQ